MAKRYKTIFAHGYVDETSSPHTAYNFGSYDGQQFFIKGVEVTACEFYAAVEQHMNEKYAAKCETHKQVRVLDAMSLSG